jgi:hypothetical protein
MAPLGVVLAAVLLVRGGAAPALRFLAWWAGIGVAVSIACLAAFGPADVLFNAVTLPSRMPWYREAEAGGRVASVAFVAGLFARLAWLPALGLVALATGARLAGRRQTLADGPAWILVAVAAALAPAAIAGGAMVGGFLNTFSVSTYFLAAAATTALAALAAGDRRFRIALAAALVVLAVREAAGPAGVASVPGTVARLGAWGDGPQDRAYRAALARPGTLYLPWNPLATLLAEDRLDNNEIGAWNRDLAGVAIADALWRRHLPPRLAMTAFRPAEGAFAWLPPPTGRLPELARETTLPGLDGWTVLAVGAVAPPSAGGLEPPSDAPRP